jgi:hypothetical protein
VAPISVAIELIYHLPHKTLFCNNNES